MSAPHFNNYHPSYYSSNSFGKSLINYNRCLFDSEQLAVLRENGRIRSMYPDETLMVKLQDVTHVLPQLKALVLKNDEQIQQYLAAAAAAGGPAKRPRTS